MTAHFEGCFQWKYSWPFGLDSALLYRVIPRIVGYFTFLTSGHEMPVASTTKKSTYIFLVPSENTASELHYTCWVYTDCPC